MLNFVFILGWFLQRPGGRHMSGRGGEEDRRHHVEEGVGEGRAHDGEGTSDGRTRVEGDNTCFHCDPSIPDN